MPFSQGHALLIGVGTHQHCPTLNVPITVADAQAVAAVLQDAGAAGYPAGQVKLISKEGATKFGILAALDDLAARATAGQTAFVFFCGHGALGTDGNYYLVSHDVQVGGNRVVAGTAVSEAELLQKLKAIPAERVLMVFNACHSGNISPSLGTEDSALATSNPSEDTAAALLGTGKGRIIVTACGEQQLSYIGKGQLTLFTQALVDGLRGKGVANSRGFISAFSLYTYIYETVTENVQALYNKAQQPELTVLRGVGPFAVALYKGASSLGGEFGGEPLPEGMAAREVSPEKSARRLAQRINTGGGAYVAGDVNTGGGDFVGRDKIVHGDEVHGDKVTGDKVTGDKVNGVKIGNVDGGIHGSVISGGNVGNVNLGSDKPE